MEFTGERVIPGQTDPDLFNEHLARYSFARALVGQRRVLDAGCGAGYGTARLARRATYVVGLDNALEALRGAREEYAGSNIFFQQGDCAALPFSDESFDVVLHHAVFEHVPDPEKGYREIFRVLRRGGSTIGLVDPQDHRNFSSFEEYHPLKFLEYSRPEWYEIARSINFHNQVTTPEHKKIIQAQGFSIQVWEVLMKMDVPEGMWRSFHSMFRELPRSEIGILRFGFFASRPNEP